MNMREYRPEDLETVMNIANEAWKPIRKMSNAALGPEIVKRLNPPGSDNSKGQQLKQQIDCGKYGIAICEHEGAVVGFITWKLDGITGDICNNAALPGSGLKGIGQMMYKYVLDIFRKEGVKVAKVTTGMDWAHAPARRAYERAGFKNRIDSTTYFMELD